MDLRIAGADLLPPPLTDAWNDRAFSLGCDGSR
jgi:hypothetical protein